jgi:hypothetical protein
LVDESDVRKVRRDGAATGPNGKRNGGGEKYR